MTKILFLAIFLLTILLIQILISRTNASWAKWIIPVLLFIACSTFYLYNVSEAFANLATFGRFLVYHEGPGLLAFILKTGIIFLPFVISFIILIVFLSKSKKNKNKGKNEIEKMLIKDLS